MLLSTLLRKAVAQLQSQDLSFAGLSTVLLRPYVQGVLWVTPHVHLIGCSDRDITGD